MNEHVMFEDAEATAETEKGLKVSIAGEDIGWIPKSAIHEDSETYKRGTNGTLIIAKWLADKNELEGEAYEPA